MGKKKQIMKRWRRDERKKRMRRRAKREEETDLKVELEFFVLDVAVDVADKESAGRVLTKGVFTVLRVALQLRRGPWRRTRTRVAS